MITAIVLVLAAVLYILVGGILASNTTSRPADIGMALSSQGDCGTSSVMSTYNISLNPSSPIFTDQFGFKVTAAGGAIVPLGTASSSLGANCNTGLSSGSWYGILWPALGQPPLATYGTGGNLGWTALGANSLPVSINDQCFFEIVSNGAIGTDQAVVFGQAGQSVNGQVSL